MALLIDHQPITHPAGSYQYTVNLNRVQSSTIRIALTRKTTATPGFWDDAVSVLVGVELSFDNGQSWVEWLPSFGAPGGVVVIKGEEATETSCYVPMPPNGDRARLNVSVTGGVLVSELTVEQVNG